jgi:hypothetical protein
LKRWTKITLAMLAAFVMVLIPSLAQAEEAGPQQVSYIVLPHPDDEWQTWSLVENSPSNYKVFILLTQGEQTAYCGSIKWTQQCKDERITSWLSYLTQMSQTDTALPGDWDAPRDVTLPARGYSLTVDNGAGLVPASTSARVWADKRGKGAAVVFDLGDGDLTRQEVKWAIESVRDNRAAMGINDTLPNWNALGAYWNSYYPGCAVYTHPDHRAVHEALWNYSYGFVYNAAATCGADPDAQRKQLTTAPSNGASWGASGAFPAHYGWLGGWTFSGQTQTDLFHAPQAWWTRVP